LPRKSKCPSWNEAPYRGRKGGYGDKETGWAKAQESYYFPQKLQDGQEELKSASVELILFFLFIFLLLCWVGYIVAFTKILTTYQIYHT
jgi:hypothetical protein